MIIGTAIENVKVGERIQVWPGVDEDTPAVATITDIAKCESGLKFTIDRDGQVIELDVRRGLTLNVVE